MTYVASPVTEQQPFSQRSFLPRTCAVEGEERDEVRYLQAEEIRAKMEGSGKEIGNGDGDETNWKARERVYTFRPESGFGVLPLN